VSCPDSKASSLSAAATASTFHHHHHYYMIWHITAGNILGTINCNLSLEHAIGELRLHVASTGGESA
jgi:hypothetical protein